MNNNAQIVEWDDYNKKEVEEAKSIYITARKNHRKIADLDGNVIDHFTSQLCGFRILEKETSPSQFKMRVLNEEMGDEIITWDSKFKHEIKEAAELFKEYIDKGWKALTCDPVSGKKRRILSFDPNLEEIHFKEGIRQTLADFVKTFGGMQLVPRTYKS